MHIKHLVSFTLLFTIVIALGQDKEQPIELKDYKSICKSYFLNKKINETASEKSIANFLKIFLPNLTDYRTDISLNYIKHSMAGTHYSFHQTFNGIEIYQSEMKVNVNNANTITSVFDNSVNTKHWVDFTSIQSNANIIIVENGNPIESIKSIENDIEQIK